jgi:fatty-acyl-CoA synthase
VCNPSRCDVHWNPPSERWGQEVVALVETKPNVTVAPEDLFEMCVENLAKFKAPKDFLFVDKVRRLGNGKADYRWAQSEATRQAVTS